MPSRTAPTRTELLRSRRRLERVERGVDLLRRRREALVREIFELTRPAADERTRIGRAAAAAYAALGEALGAEGAEGLAGLGRPSRPLEVELDVREIWGLAVPTLRNLPGVVRSMEDRALVPFRSDPSPLLASERFEELLALLLAAASRETLVRRLGAALRRTSRQVQSLERRLAPALHSEIRRIEGILGEREREEQVRLRRFGGDVRKG